MSALAAAIAQLSAELSDAHLGAVMETCRSSKGFDAATRSKLRTTVPGPHRALLQPLLDSWQAEPAVPGEAVALAIESIGAAARMANHPAVTIVCTGPTSPVASVRLTSQVVLQLIDAASDRVTISSFSSYRIPSVVSALDAAVSRGVQVDLILESQENLEHGGGAEAFDGYRVFVWPSANRPANAKLHAKSFIVDNDAVLLTSANLSNAAFNASLELGALIRGGSVARSIQQHFDALIAAGVLRPAFGEQGHT